MYGISLVCVTLFVWSGNPIYRTEPNLGTNTFVACNQTGELHNIMIYLASITFNLTLINLTRVNRAHQVHTRCDRSTMFSMKIAVSLINFYWIICGWISKFLQNDRLKMLFSLCAKRLSGSLVQSQNRPFLRGPFHKNTFITTQKFSLIILNLSWIVHCCSIGLVLWFWRF